MCHQKLIIFTWLLLALGAGGLASAAIINVPADQPTIQAAINAAVSGVDEVVVAPGTYNEIINFNGKAVNLRSSGGAAVTILDGTGLNSSIVLTFNGEGPGTVLDGFTLTNGTGSDFGFGPSGGGMWNLGNSSPTVRNCVFTGNSVTGVGGGMVNFAGLSQPTVTNCAFLNNSAGFGGGGMWNAQFANPTVTNCTFVGNTVIGGGGGFAGGGMYNQLNDATLFNCTFSGNSAPEGGALYIVNNSNVTVTNCTFIGNSATLAGGGIFTNMNPVVNNSVLWANSDPGGVDESAQIHIQAGTPIVTYNDIQALVPGGFFDSGTNTSNINADPLFVDPLGPDGISGTADDDVHLLPGSPCIEAGDPAFVPAPGATDIDGEPRIMACFVDMGVDEFAFTLISGDMDGNGVVELHDLVLFVDTLLGNGAAVDQCIVDMNSDGNANGGDIGLFVTALLGP